jgi:hypothetical protein
MKKTSCALALLFALGASPAVRADSRPSVKRFALVVGANHGALQEPTLRYAERDAERIGETLASVGDFPPDQVLLMKGVSAADVRDALIRLNTRVRREEGDTLLFVFYSGHADAEDLHLAGSTLPLHELRSLVEGSAASSRVLVLDACRSGALTRIKGGRPVPNFDVRVDLPALPRGTAFITSSTATEDSQESDWLRGSIFTHYFNSALLGAADQNRDGRVTLGEAFAFAAAETHAATARTEAGPQNPTYRFDLGGREDLVLTTPGGARAHLGVLRFTEPGHYFVERTEPSGAAQPIAEIATGRPGARVTLPPGRYQVTLRTADYLMEAPATLTPDAVVDIAPTDMRSLDYARVVRKGMREHAVNSLSLSAGGRTNALDVGPAWQGVLAFRQDRRRFSWEARLGGGGGSQVNEPGLFLRNVTGTASLLALRAFDFSWVTAAVGLEAGATLIRQQFGIAPGVQYSYLNDARLRDRTSYAGFAAPTVELELPLRTRGYFRLELAMPVDLMKTGDTLRTEGRHLVVGLRGLAGLGVYF